MYLLSVVILCLVIKFFFELIGIDAITMKVINALVLVALIICFIFSIRH
jgi:hypothetical protein